MAHLGTVKEDSNDRNPRTNYDPGHMCAVWGHVHRPAPQQALLLRGVPPGMESRPPGHLPRVRAGLHPSRSTQVYCTPACRERAGRRARYARGRDTVRAYTRNGGEGERSAVCPVCAAVFTPARSSQVYCSPACRRARANAARTRTAHMTAAARACALIRRLHVPGDDGACAECAHPWPCETRRLTDAVTGGERP